MNEKEPIEQQKSMNKMEISTYVSVIINAISKWVKCFNQMTERLNEYKKITHTYAFRLI